MSNEPKIISGRKKNEREQHSVTLAFPQPLLEGLDEVISKVRVDYGINTSRSEVIRTAVKTIVCTFDSARTGKNPLTYGDVENIFEQAFKDYWKAP
ncbi:ribbon-helix-helix domain-containing protein [Pelagibius sp. Alg239-R121]|uniref:ribbon-helix-helix domain-containing protein n=1 Tax=Pelagibius sp. Alg239-R121 TaxID=2993448 RepID=UPI0024A6D205|nr:ribbon-helix-helix domain-containing protein [Pelagibius sp. Alg239-R121]